MIEKSLAESKVVIRNFARLAVMELTKLERAGEIEDKLNREATQIFYIHKIINDMDKLIKEHEAEAGAIAEVEFEIAKEMKSQKGEDESAMAMSDDGDN